MCACVRSGALTGLSDVFVCDGRGCDDGESGDGADHERKVGWRDDQLAHLPEVAAEPLIGRTPQASNHYEHGENDDDDDDGERGTRTSNGTQTVTGIRRLSETERSERAGSMEWNEAAEEIVAACSMQCWAAGEGNCSARWSNPTPPHLCLTFEFSTAVGIPTSQLSSLNSLSHKLPAVAAALAAAAAAPHSHSPSHNDNTRQRYHTISSPARPTRLPTSVTLDL